MTSNHILQKRIESIKESNEISKEDKSNIVHFKTVAISNGIKSSTVLKYVACLKTLIEKFTNKPLSKMDKEGIVNLLEKSESNEKYSEATKKQFRLSLKKFYQVLEGYDWNSKEYPPKIKWVRTTLKSSRRKLPSELLTKGEIKKMVEVSKNLRDKCMIMLLYESGCRVGEFMNIKIKDLEFDDYGATAKVKGKTGERVIRLVSSVPSISNWLNIHPHQDDRDAKLICNIASNSKKKSLTYRAVNNQLKELAKRAGIKKNIYPHLFRHSRASELANHLTEAQMCEFFGWKQGSDMPAIYVHLSQKNIDNAILKMHGMVNNHTEEEELKVKVCPRCQTKNDPATKRCNRCQMPLDPKETMKVQSQKKLKQKVNNLVMEKLIETGAIEKDKIARVMNQLLQKEGEEYG